MRGGRLGMVRIFCDFDGTIVPQDVGDAFFERFSGPEWLEDTGKFRDGELTSSGLFARLVSRISGLTPDAVVRFSDSFSPDPTFRDFAAWTREREYPLMILSDGLDAYIAAMLSREGLDIPFRANALAFNPDGSCAIRQPYRDEWCERCGTCKRNQMLVHSADRDVIVLIGDGLSDFCAARHADVVFAKAELETYCQRENISFRRFRDFTEVRADLEGMIARGDLRRPRQAALNRASVWSMG
ncbi:MAG: HAD-IB family phosphatase [Ignavibacteria bacterium]|nr:HAD-IB family phosphatase [Ignavibacteria bacterium]